MQTNVREAEGKQLTAGTPEVTKLLGDRICMPSLTSLSPRPRLFVIAPCNLLPVLRVHASVYPPALVCHGASPRLAAKV